MLSILSAPLTVESFSLPQANLLSPGNFLWKSSPGVQHFFKILYNYIFFAYKEYVLHILHILCSKLHTFGRWRFLPLKLLMITIDTFTVTVSCLIFIVKWRCQKIS